MCSRCKHEHCTYVVPIWHRRYFCWCVYSCLNHSFTLCTFCYITKYACPVHPLLCFYVFGTSQFYSYHSGALFTKLTDALPQDLVKSRSREIRVYTFPIALKFERHLGSSAAEMPIKFQSDTIIITPTLMASRFTKFGRKTSYRLEALDYWAGIGTIIWLP